MNLSKGVLKINLFFTSIPLICKKINLPLNFFCLNLYTLNISNSSETHTYNQAKTEAIAWCNLTSHTMQKELNLRRKKIIIELGTQTHNLRHSAVCLLETKSKQMHLTHTGFYSYLFIKNTFLPKPVRNRNELAKR